MAKSGIRTVDYATEYSRRLDTAVRQNVLWGIKECNQNVADFVGKEFGADGYEISYHSHPRESHADMAGKTFAIGKARTVNGVYYPSFEEEAEPLLKEFGCLHFKFPILLGISRPAYSKEQLEEFKANDKKKFEFEDKQYTMYEGTQLQRQIETEIRHQKDRAVLAKETGEEITRRQAQERINQLKNKYAELSQASGLPTKIERMQVKGFRSVKEIDVNEARIDDILYIIPPIRGDAIKPKSIYKEIQKSNVGREAWQYIIEKEPNIEINYTLEAPKGIRGYQYGKNIYIFVKNTKTIKVTTETLIHEITHMKLDIGGDQWSEAVCIAQEKRHTKDVLTYSDMRDIIKETKRLYPEMKWREK